jgi:hypothetical protein
VSGSPGGTRTAASPTARCLFRGGCGLVRQIGQAFEGHPDAALGRRIEPEGLEGLATPLVALLT